MADAPTTSAATKERSRKRLVRVLVGVIVVFLIYFIWSIVSRKPDHYKVLRVDQPSRLVLDYDEGTYLIGVEAPPLEERRVGQKAWTWVSQRILKKTIRIVPGDRPRDEAGWFLAYVYYPGDDGKEHFLNEELLRLGYARLHLEYPNDQKFRPLFEAAEAEAKAKKLGVWQDGYVFPGR